MSFIPLIPPKETLCLSCLCTQLTRYDCVPYLYRTYNWEMLLMERAPLKEALIHMAADSCH